MHDELSEVPLSVEIEEKREMIPNNSTLSSRELIAAGPGLRSLTAEQYISAIQHLPTGIAVCQASSRPRASSPWADIFAEASSHDLHRFAMARR